MSENSDLPEATEAAEIFDLYGGENYPERDIDKIPDNLMLDRHLYDFLCKQLGNWRAMQLKRNLRDFSGIPSIDKVENSEAILNGFFDGLEDGISGYSVSIGFPFRVSNTPRALANYLLEYQLQVVGEDRAQHLFEIRSHGQGEKIFKAWRECSRRVEKLLSKHGLSIPDAMWDFHRVLFKRLKSINFISYDQFLTKIKEILNRRMDKGLGEW